MTAVVRQGAEERAAGFVTVAAMLAALALANTPMREFYLLVHHTPVSVEVGAFGIDKPLILWINDGLMVFFFLLMGVSLGLLLGRQLGVFAFAWLAIRLGLAQLLSAVSWRHLYATGVLAGIGFTMSLFISGLAFDNTAALTAARQGVLTASALSAVTGAAALYVFLPRTGAGEGGR